MEVPYQQLSPDALRGLIEEFVTRYGTDNGDLSTLDEKVEQVFEQLKGGEAVIVFDEDSETCDIRMKNTLG